MHTLDSSHYGYLAQEVIPGPGYSPTSSPPYSPFLQSETLFNFPNPAAGTDAVAGTAPAGANAVDAMITL